MTPTELDTYSAERNSAISILKGEFGVSRETIDRLDTFATLLKAESEKQNLIAPSTWPLLWRRHILDSAQLLRYCEPAASGLWIDIGSGAGFPGIITALLSKRQTWLVEPRQLRAEFLRNAADCLKLGDNVTVCQSRVEALEPHAADVISARAVAPLPKLLAMGQRFSTPQTRWLLPKGRNAAKELQDAKRGWHFRLAEKPSLTDPDAALLIGTVKGPKR